MKLAFKALLMLFVFPCSAWAVEDHYYVQLKLGLKVKGTEPWVSGLEPFSVGPKETDGRSPLNFPLNGAYSLKRKLGEDDLSLLQFKDGQLVLFMLAEKINSFDGWRRAQSIYELLKKEYGEPKMHVVAKASSRDTKGHVAPVWIGQGFVLLYQVVPQQKEGGPYGTVLKAVAWDGKNLEEFLENEKSLGVLRIAVDNESKDLPFR